MELRFARRDLIAGAGAALVLRQARAAPFTWENDETAAQGFQPDLSARLDKLIANQRVWASTASWWCATARSCSSATSRAKKTRGARNEASLLARIPCTIFTR